MKSVLSWRLVAGLALASTIKFERAKVRLAGTWPELRAATLCDLCKDVPRKPPGYPSSCTGALERRYGRKDASCIALFLVRTIVP